MIVNDFTMKFLVVTPPSIYQFATSYTWKSFFHKIWKVISVAKSVCKAIHQGPGTGWLPSDIKNS